MIALYQSTIREQGRKLNEFDGRLQALSAPPPPTPEDDAKKLFADPRALIKEEISSAIAPLLVFVRDFQGGNEYDRTKARMKSDPRFAPIFAVAEDLIDETMKGKPPTAEMLLSAVASVKGAIDFGMFPGRSLNAAPPPPPPANPGAPQMQPPYVPPSAPPANRPPANRPRELTELEQRVAREQFPGTADYAAKYLAWLEMDARSVAYTKPEKVAT